MNPQMTQDNMQNNGGQPNGDQVAASLAFATHLMQQTIPKQEMGSMQGGTEMSDNEGMKEDMTESMKEEPQDHKDHMENMKKDIIDEVKNVIDEKMSGIMDEIKSALEEDDGKQN